MLSAFGAYPQYLEPRTDFCLTERRYEKTVFAISTAPSDRRCHLAIALRQPREIDAQSSNFRSLDASGHLFRQIWAMTTMRNLEQMSRVLYSHVWDDVSQWASAFDHLASLSDTEIAALANGGRGDGRGRPREISAEMRDRSS
jgi:hypothetical protein